MADQSMLWSEEHLASLSQSPVSEADWAMSVATSRSNFLGLLTGKGPDGWSGRTSPAYFPQLPTSLPIHVLRQSTWKVVTDPETGKKSWSKTSTTQTKTMRSPASWPDFQNSGTSMPTGLLTLNTSEFHSGAVASSLSDILETGVVPQRFYLSATACRGILRRAEKRGKSLPPSLLAALEAVASGQTSTATGGRSQKDGGGNNTSGPIEVATACNAHGGPAGRLDFESETFITQTVATLDASCGKLQGCSGQDMLHQHSHLIPQISNPLSAKPYGDRGDGDLEKLIPETAHSLRADGFDASEDGPGRGTPLVPVAAHMTGAGFWQEGFGTLRAREQDSHENLVAFRAAGQDGFTPSEISPPIAGTDGGGAGVPTIAFSCKDSGLDCGDLSPTLRSMGHDSSHANAGGQVAVAFNLRGREGGSMAEMAEMAEMASVRVASGGSSRSYVGQAIGWSEELTAHEDCAGTIQRGGADGRHEGVMTPQMAVRRLTVEECEKLQGIPPGHTQVPYRGKPMADGPRYKMIGNGFAIPVVNWIGQRIQMIEDQETPCSP